MESVVCKKVCYLNEETARHDLEKIKKKSKNKNIPFRSYKCEKCGWWHLTSSTKGEHFENIFQDNLRLSNELLELKKQFEELKSKNAKEVSKIVSTDQRILQLNQVIAANNKRLQSMRKANEELVVKNIQLQKKVEAFIDN